MRPTSPSSSSTLLLKERYQTFLECQRFHNKFMMLLLFLWPMVASASPTYTEFGIPPTFRRLLMQSRSGLITLAPTTLLFLHGPTPTRVLRRNCRSRSKCSKNCWLPTTPQQLFLSRSQDRTTLKRPTRNAISSVPIRLHYLNLSNKFQKCCRLLLQSFKTRFPRQPTSSCFVLHGVQ